MDDLVQWLRAQLDEDERIARAAGGASWEELPVSGWVHTSALPDTEWQPPGYDHHVASAPLPVDQAHAVEHDPARVLREIDAARVLLTQYDALKSGMPDDMTGVFALETAIRAKASVYTDRSGYREEWRP